jgi:hypothetical protein
MNVVLTAAAAALTLSAAPAPAQLGGIFGRSSDRIPSGHMPPRGMCRVWIDGVPAGRQPRPTDCRTAERQERYYEERYRRNARVIYGERSNGRYENGRIYGSRSGTNCRTVERVVMGRVIRQNSCDNNGGVYGRDGRTHDRNGRVYDRNGREIYRDGRGVWRDKKGRVYDRRGRDRDKDSDSH